MSIEQASNAALIERVQALRAILPRMAEDVARARREAARLRVENGELRRRLGERGPADTHLSAA